MPKSTSGLSAESRAPRTRERFGWQVAAVLALLLLITVRVALPWVAERLLENIVSDRLHIQFAVDDVDLGFLEGEVAVEGLSMRIVGMEQDIASAARIAIDADWGALLTGELRAERIAIEEPRLFFEFGADGRLNWEQLAGPDPVAAEAPLPEEAGGTFQVSATVFDIGAGAIRLTDRSPDGLPELAIGIGALRLDDLVIGRDEPANAIRWALDRAEAKEWHLGVTPLEHDRLDFALEAQAGPMDDAGSLPLELNLTRTDGLALTIVGTASPDPLACNLTIEWQGLSSRSVAPLLLRGAKVESGTAQGSLAVSLDLAEGAARGIRLAGTVRHDELSLRVENDPPIHVEIERFEGEIEEIWLPIPAQPTLNPEPTRIVWKRIDLFAPAIDVDLGSDEEPTVPETEPVVEDEPPADGEPTKEQVPFDLTIADLTLHDGRLTWHDPTLGADSKQEFRGIRFSARALHWPPTTIEHAMLEIGSLGSTPLRIEGPLRADGAEFAVRGTGIKLAPWNPLISQYSDYTVTGGSLAIQSDIELKGETYEAPTKLTLRRIRVATEGTGFQNTFGIPISTAIALLSDPSGNIDIKIPVSGNLGAGGELRVGVSIVDALREGIMNAITSVITSPLGVAGSLLAKGHDLAFLRIGEAFFEPGITALDPAAKAELDRAAAFVAKSPDARLSLSADIVSGDIEAPGAKAKTTRVFGTMLRGMFGSKRELDARSYTLGLELAKARLEAASQYLASTGVLPPERIIQIEWDENIADGSPRIVLRLDTARDTPE